MKNRRCIVTGAAGFIGSALVRLLIRETDAEVLVVDKLTYAGVPESLKEAGLDPAKDICEPADLESRLAPSISAKRLAFIHKNI